MYNKVVSELNYNKRYIYASYLISVFTMLPQFIASLYSIGTTKHTIYLFIILITLFFISKFSKLLFGIFIIYLNMTNILIGHIFIHWGYTNGTVRPRLNVSAISPKSETLEYLITYIDYRDGVLFFYTLLILFVLYRFIYYFTNSLKILKFLGLIISVIIIIGIKSYKNPLIHGDPFDIPYLYIQANDRGRIYSFRKESIEKLTYKSEENTTMIYDKIVIIQGEAVNKHHMSIYNYDKNTTPFLASLKSEKNFYIFNAIAPTNQTRYSVPILHTKANVHNFQKLFLTSKSYVGEYRDYGYKTYWFSNQSALGHKDDNSIASIAYEANEYYFENTDYTSAKPDAVLVSYLKNHISSEDKELYVLHLIGSHANYTMRYTKEHILFSNPSNIQEKYDNTIFYTDYILKDIFKHFLNKFPNKKVLFIYISDHGEVVSKNKYGHGFLPPFKDEYDIPFVIYSTVKNHRIDIMYQENNNSYFNLENLNYMLQYINGVRNDLNISYSNDIFSLEPKNIFNYNTLDFYKDM